MVEEGESRDRRREAEADELLETIAQNTPIVLFALDADGVFTRSEGRGLAALGLEPGEVIGRSVFDVYGDQAAVLDAAERALDGDDVHRIVDIDGVAFEVWYQPVGEDPVEEVLGVGIDVTDRVRHDRQLERVNEASRKLHEAGSRQAIADEAVAIAEDVLGHPYTGVWFYDADADELVSVAGNRSARKYGDDEGQLAFSDGCIEMNAFHSRELQFIEDYSTVERPAFPDAEIGTVFLLPLGDHGLLTVASPEVLDIDPTDRDLIEILARDVTVALDREKRERLLERLNEATRELVVANSQQEIANRIVEINRRVLEEPASVVWLYDADENVLEPVAGINPMWRDDHVERAFRDLDPIQPGTAEMETFRGEGTAFFEDYHGLENPAHPETVLGAILAVPIGEYGLLTVGAPSAAEIGTSTPDLVEILARDAAVALNRVKRESAVERLHSATRDLIVAGTREEIATRTVEAAEDILDHPQSVVRLLSDDGTSLVPVAMTDWIRRTIPDRPTFRVGEGPVGTAFERQEPLHVDGSELEGRMSHQSTQTLLCMPIGRYGVLTIGDPESAAFDDSELRLVMILASNAESAFDRVDRELRLERQNERLEAFAEIVSHDLRNPLNVVAGHLDLARQGVANYDAMGEAIDRMGTIIDDVLELAREGRDVTEPEALHLEESARLAWGLIDTGDATLVVEEDRRLQADPDRFRRLLENLLRNAVEHGGDTVRLGATEAGFYVGDDGPGIPAERRDEVFEMGYSTGDRGTGLGLAIVDEIATAHGWSVAATDGRDGGARIEVTGVTAP